MADDPIVVHVVDDDPDFRQSLVALLGAAGYRTVAYATGAAFLEAAPNLADGCVLLDLHMPGMDGFEIQTHLHLLGVKLPVIVMTVHGAVATAVQAMRAGAEDFIEKPFDVEPLLAKLAQAVAQPMGARAHPDLAQATSRVASLSRREHEVLNGLLVGRPNKVIAHDLGISPRTVEIHRARMLERLGVNSLAEAIRLAVLAEVAG